MAFSPPGQWPHPLLMALPLTGTWQASQQEVSTATCQVTLLQGRWCWPRCAQGQVAEETWPVGDQPALEGTGMREWTAASWEAGPPRGPSQRSRQCRLLLGSLSRKPRGRGPLKEGLREGGCRPTVASAQAKGARQPRMSRSQACWAGQARPPTCSPWRSWREPTPTRAGQAQSVGNLLSNVRGVSPQLRRGSNSQPFPQLRTGGHPARHATWERVSP